jgi:hypothetical protein
VRQILSEAVKFTRGLDNKKMHKKSPHVPKQHADFSYLKSDNARSTLPVPGKMSVVPIMAGLLARDSSSRRLPGLPTSDVMPFVLAYSGGSAGEWLALSATPLPYQAFTGTVIEYSVVLLRCIIANQPSIPLLSGEVYASLIAENMVIGNIKLTYKTEYRFNK